MKKCGRFIHIIMPSKCETQSISKIGIQLTDFRNYKFQSEASIWYIDAQSQKYTKNACQKYTKRQKHTKSQKNTSKIQVNQKCLRVTDSWQLDNLYSKAKMPAIKGYQVAVDCQNDCGMLTDNRVYTFEMKAQTELLDFTCGFCGAKEKKRLKKQIENYDKASIKLGQIKKNSVTR